MGLGWEEIVCKMMIVCREAGGSRTRFNGLTGGWEWGYTNEQGFWHWCRGRLNSQFQCSWGIYVRIGGSGWFGLLGFVVDRLEDRSSIAVDKSAIVMATQLTA